MLAGHYAATRMPKGLHRLEIHNPPASMELTEGGTNAVLEKSLVRYHAGRKNRKENRKTNGRSSELRYSLVDESFLVQYGYPTIHATNAEEHGRLCSNHNLPENEDSNIISERSVCEVVHDSHNFVLLVHWILRQKTQTPPD